MMISMCFYHTIPVQLFFFTHTKELFGKSETFNGPQKNDWLQPFAKWRTIQATV